MIRLHDPEGQAPEVPDPEIRVWIVESGQGADTPGQRDAFDSFAEANAQRERLAREGLVALLWEM
jgi:hypothetical protein